MKCNKILLDFHKMFLNPYIFINVPRYPGYQLFATLVASEKNYYHRADRVSTALLSKRGIRGSSPHSKWTIWTPLEKMLIWILDTAPHVKQMLSKF